MPLDEFIQRAKALKSQGCNNTEILRMLNNYGATADEADKALKELQKQERKNRPKDF